MKRLTFIFCLLTVICYVHAQPAFNKPHGLYKIPMLITISAQSPDSKIYYTTDGSEPTKNSTLYTKAFLIKSTTILRAAEFRADTLASPIATCSYIYPTSVLSQPNNPVGYPKQWGKYAAFSGTAIADYEMDPELTSNPSFAQKIIDGLYSLPILSLVTDKGNLFNTTADEKTGGIYIFTGAPVSGYPGRGWERPVSAELFGGTAEHDLQIDCAMTIHGGTGRNPEKNPKHSLRLKFKSDYGPSKLLYPIFGQKEGEVKKFNSLIVRNMFNDTWGSQWDQRGTSLYIRELWVRLMQKKMGWPSSNGIYVHLFLNGMYWGFYCLSERINDDFCKTHFGGDKEDWDVVKVTEDSHGQRLEASDGDLTKWYEMVALAEKAADNRYYFQLTGQDGSEPLIDVDNFIDYILLNQYIGNEDWDYHNWTAIRNRKRADRGFQFCVWDAEIIFRNVETNVLGTYYNGLTTHIFKYLMQNAIFRRRYVDRAYKLLAAPDGLLTEKGVVTLWDSIYNDISLALYDESARWGDYRRDVHPYTAKGELYTPDKHYQAEMDKLLTQYFPRRTNIFLQQLIDKEWYPRSKPPVFLVNGEESLCDTLTFDDELTLSGTPLVLYTMDGTDPVSWIYSSSGKRTSSAITYQRTTNILDMLPREEKWVTVKAIVQSFQGWSPMVERRFYIGNVSSVERLAPGTTLGRRKIYDIRGYQVNGNKLGGGIYIIDGKKTYIK